MTPEQIHALAASEVAAYALLVRARPHLEALQPIIDEMLALRASTSKQLGNKLPGGVSGDNAGPWAGCGAVSRLFASAALTLTFRLLDRIDTTMRARAEHGQQIAALTDCVEGSTS